MPKYEDQRELPISIADMVVKRCSPPMNLSKHRWCVYPPRPQYPISRLFIYRKCEEIPAYLFVFQDRDGNVFVKLHSISKVTFSDFSCLDFFASDQGVCDVFTYT